MPTISGDLFVTGSVVANQNLQAGQKVSANLDVGAGRDVVAINNVVAGNAVEAGRIVTSHVDIGAGNDVVAQHDLTAGNNVNAFNQVRPLTTPSYTASAQTMPAMPRVDNTTPAKSIPGLTVLDTLGNRYTMVLVPPTGMDAATPAMPTHYTLYFVLQP